MTDIAANIAKIQQQIKYVPHRQALLCLAVSKQQSEAKIRQAYHAGISAFGENYIQEALEKIEALKDLELEWHYIGEIQSKKCKKIAAHFDWVESVDNLKIAEKLNQSNQTLSKKQNILVQVNLFNEAQKNGCSIEELPLLLQAIQTLKYLHCRGLMTILPQGLSQEEQLTSYQRLSQLMQQYNQEFGINMDTLSMGMSEDYPQAILAGSNIIRLGQAIFGPRSYA